MKTYTCVKCNKEFKQAYLRRDKPYCSRKCRRRDVTQCLNPDCHVEIPKIKGKRARDYCCDAHSPLARECAYRNCSNIFLSFYSNKKYCRWLCCRRERHHREKEDRRRPSALCVNCGKEFQTYHDSHKACSRTCYKRYTAKQNIARLNADDPKCEECGKSFTKKCRTQLFASSSVAAVRKAGGSISRPS